MTVPKPTPKQYAWHERYRAMLLCLDPATWQGLDLDDHSTPLSEVRPSRLDVDQWCAAALGWGARMIIMVAKHTGGFCWSRTQTSAYGVKELEWRDGRADVAEVWFDGGLVIPVTDILERYAPDAMVFRGPDATIRWSGTERGEIPAPGWSTFAKPTDDSVDPFESVIAGGLLDRPLPPRQGTDRSWSQRAYQSPPASRREAWAPGRMDPKGRTDR